jgi:hypothetical protein
MHHDGPRRRRGLAAADRTDGAQSLRPSTLILWAQHRLDDPDSLLLLRDRVAGPLDRGHTGGVVDKGRSKGVAAVVVASGDEDEVPAVHVVSGGGTGRVATVAGAVENRTENRTGEEDVVSHASRRKKEGHACRMVAMVARRSWGQVHSLRLLGLGLGRTQLLREATQHASPRN